MSIEVKVLFFGAAREIVGADEKPFSFAAQTFVTDAFKEILAAFPALPEKFGKSLLFAVNQAYVNDDQVVQNGDELAIFPPVSGGSTKTFSQSIF